MDVVQNESGSTYKLIIRLSNYGCTYCTVLPESSQARKGSQTQDKYGFVQEN